MDDMELKVEIASLKEQIVSLCRSVDDLRADLKAEITTHSQVMEWVNRMKGAGALAAALQVIVVAFVCWVFMQVTMNKEKTQLLEYRIQAMEKSTWPRSSQP